MQEVYMQDMPGDGEEGEEEKEEPGSEESEEEV